MRGGELECEGSGEEAEVEYGDATEERDVRDAEAKDGCVANCFLIQARKPMRMLELQKKRRKYSASNSQNARQTETSVRAPHQEDPDLRGRKTH